MRPEAGIDTVFRIKKALVITRVRVAVGIEFASTNLKVYKKHIVTHFSVCFGTVLGRSESSDGMAVALYIDI